MPERNLVIIHRGADYERDFREIAEKISIIDPEISVFCIDPRTIRAVPDDAWERPTLTVALLSQFKANIRRGTVLTNRAIHKPGQHRAFVEAGVPTPPTLRFIPGMRLDPIIFGEYVVIKPINPNLGSYGRGIQLFRRKKLETMMLADFPIDHLIYRERDGFLVQRFIDTGPNLPVYRVLTLFGVPLFSFKAWDIVALPSIAGPDSDIEKLRVTSNNGNFRTRAASADDDVLKLGALVGQSLPDIPLLGTDIIREHKTGRLFALECNPGGNVWHFSSRMTAGIRQQMGGASLVGAKKAEQIGRQMMIDQFGAFDRAAEVLVRKTCELAA
jgi:hypothetical protein